MTSHDLSLSLALSIALAACSPVPAFASDDGAQDELAQEVAGADDGQQTEEGVSDGQGDENEPSADTGNESSAAAQAGSGDAQAQPQGESDAVALAVAGVETAIREFDTGSQSAIYLVGLGVCAGVGVGSSFVRGLDAWGNNSQVVTHHE